MPIDYSQIGAGRPEVKRRKQREAEEHKRLVVLEAALGVGGKAKPPVTTLEPGTLVRLLRRQLRWTQRRLGEKAGVSQPHLARIERGEADPPVSTFKRLVVAMHCTPLFLAKSSLEYHVARVEGLTLEEAEALDLT